MGLSQPNQGPASWPEVHRSCRMGMSVFVRPGLHFVEWTRHSMDCSQIVVAYNTRQSGSQVELSRILVSSEFECFLEKNGYDKVRRYYFLDSFASRYLCFLYTFNSCFFSSDML